MTRKFCLKYLGYLNDMFLLIVDIYNRLFDDCRA